MVYTVKKGDTLFKIAKRFGVTLTKILEMNPDINNLNLIFPGQQIIIRDLKDITTSAPKIVEAYDVAAFFQNKGWIISSDYGMRKSPLTGKTSFHRGMDFAGKPKGEPIYTPIGGKVIYSSYYSGWGNLIGIQDGMGFIHLLAHLDERLKSVGTTVRVNDLIGYNGSTGNSTGPHLHYQINTPRGGIIGVNAHTDPKMFRYYP